MKKTLINSFLCLLIVLSGCVFSNENSLYDEFAISRILETTSVRWGTQKEETLIKLENEFPDNIIISENDDKDNSVSVTVMGNIDTKIGTAEKIVFKFNKSEAIDIYDEPLTEIMSKEHLNYVQLYISDSQPNKIHETLTEIFGEMNLAKYMLEAEDKVIISEFTGEYVNKSRFTLYPEASLLKNTNKDIQNKYKQMLSLIRNPEGENLERNFDIRLDSPSSYLFFIDVNISEEGLPILVQLCCGPLGIMESFESY